MKTKISNRMTALTSCFVLFAACFLASCAKDDGNYDYLSDDEVSQIKLDVDTVRTPNQMVLYRVAPGTEVEYNMKVDYAYPEHLKFRWFYLKLTSYQYIQEQVGNKMVWPPQQTISEEKDLKWTCNLDPGQYYVYCEARDTVNDMVAYYQYTPYTVVTEPDNVSGLFLLTEREGQTDIEVFRNPLMLIYNPAGSDYKVYSSSYGKYLEGKPRFIRGTHTGKTSKNAYLVATDKNLYRLSTSGLKTVNTWEDMFYSTPEVFNPQDAIFINNCEFLINDGKMHVIYANQANDMKFSEPIAGDYVAYPSLMKSTRTTWRPVEGAINAWQIIYDQKNHKFRPYFANSSQVSNFRGTIPDAVVDANSVPGDVKAVMQMGSSYTGVVTHINGKPYLYIYNFYNRIDNGDLSAQGDRSIIDLSGCEDIMNATMYTSSANTSGFYYATPKGVYGFSSVTGQTTAREVYKCESGEEITCLYMGGSIGGGWPTSNCIFWVGIWNESKQEGKLFQSEMDNTNCMPFSMFGPMFGAPDNPVITEGFGKIVSMCCIDAE